MNKRYILAVFIALFLSIFSSCVVEDRFLERASQPTPEQITLDLYFNTMQLSFRSFFHQASRIQTQLVRAEAFGGGTYAEGFGPTSFNNVYSAGYRGVLYNADVVARKALEDKSVKYNTHYAIAQTLRAYVLMELVDMFGDVPVDAFTGELNPPIRSSADTYAEVLRLLDDALVKIKLPSAADPETELFYNNDKEKWTRLINSLKLKYYIQTRLVDEKVSREGIDALIDVDMLISGKSEDFQFVGSTTLVPDSRNLIYTEYYRSTGPDAPAPRSVYIGTYAVWLLYAENRDPRWRFLIYRQANSISGTQSSLPCISQVRPSYFSAADLFCRYETFWTRDHGNNSGIPPDGTRRTVMGTYPAGGVFDGNNFARISNTSGAKGLGVLPIFTSSMVKLYRAEAAITLGTKDAGRETMLLEAAMDEFSNKLLSFNDDLGLGLSVDTSSTIYRSSQGSGAGYANNYNDYRVSVLSSFTSASTPKAKLNVLAKELYKASWGNGIEPFNTYRRTGCPDDFQQMIGESNARCIRNFLYPQQLVEFNTNATQKPQQDQFKIGQIFWDLYPEDLK